VARLKYYIFIIKQFFVFLTINLLTIHDKMPQTRNAKITGKKACRVRSKTNGKVFRQEQTTGMDTAKTFFEVGPVNFKEVVCEVLI